MKARIYYYSSILFALLISLQLHAQDPQIIDIINRVSLDSLVKHVRILSGEDSLRIYGNSYLIENRTFDQPGNELAARYLELNLAKYGLDPEIAFFNENGENIIAIQEGTLYPDEYYIICGHYDAVTDYCADDNVSACAAILETARILSGMELNRSVIYAFWDEEEIGLFGSRYSAAIADSNNTDIAGVLNIEMLGWDSDDDGLFDIHVRDTANTVQLGNLLAGTVDEYNLELMPNIINPGADRSDHAAFWYYGYTALAFGEAFFGGDGNPNYHTPGDRIDKFNMDYFYELSKLTAGTTARLAFDGLETTVAVNDEEISTQYHLSQNYPNPFNPNTVIGFQLAVGSHVQLVVYDILGHKVKTLVNKEMRPGIYNIDFDASQLSSGVYFYTLTAGQFRSTKKMTLLR